MAQALPLHFHTEVRRDHLAFISEFLEVTQKLDDLKKKKQERTLLQGWS